MRQLQNWIALAGLLALGLFVASAMAAEGPVAPAVAPGMFHPAPLQQSVARATRRLPPVERTIETVGFSEPARSVSRHSVRAAAHQPEEVSAQQLEIPSGYPIDLPTALRLADAGNLQVAFAREQVSLAMAKVDAANALWLPSVRGGANYNRHEGAIQRVEGVQILNSRGAYYAGLGAGGYGAGSPPIPGLYANFSLADALFQPLAARQFAGARSRAAVAATNDTLLQVTLAYIELLRAGEEIVISQASRGDAKQLGDITLAYADTGEGLRSDANRVQAELAVRMNDVQRAREAQRVASARLAQLLRLDPTVILQPTEPVVAPIGIVAPESPIKELIAQGLTQRPELAESRLLVGEAVVRLRQERMSVLLPSFVMGASYGGMGAGIHESLAPFHDRLDVDAIAYWQMRNLGFGEAAARRAAQSSVRATQFRQMALMDQVAREVVEAHAQIQSRKIQMSTARLGLDAATASHLQNLERIEQAKGLPIEVLQSVQALAQARHEYLRTVIDYNIAQFTLYRALGWPVKTPARLEAAAGS